MKRKSTILPMALGFIASIGLSISTPAQAGIFSISQKQEIEVGQQAARDFESKYRVSRDRRLNSLVQGIGNNLARVSSRPDLPWTFKVLDDKSVNAVALPGGYIYVFKGLIDQVDGDRDILAGVIAHEVAHVAAKHHTDMMEKQMTGGLLIGILLKGKTRDIASIFSNVYALKWTRNDEYESDRLGVRYAAQAGYDPYGLPRFLKMLQSQGGRGAPIWLSTHPSTGERVRRATQYASEAARTYGSSASRSSTRSTRSNRSSRTNRYNLGSPAPRRR